MSDPDADNLFIPILDPFDRESKTDEELARPNLTRTILELDPDESEPLMLNIITTYDRNARQDRRFVFELQRHHYSNLHVSRPLRHGRSYATACELIWKVYPRIIDQWTNLIKTDPQKRPVEDNVHHEESEKGWHRMGARNATYIYHYSGIKSEGELTVKHFARSATEDGKSYSETPDSFWKVPNTEGGTQNSRSTHAAVYSAQWNTAFVKSWEEVIRGAKDEAKQRAAPTSESHTSVSSAESPSTEDNPLDALFYL